MTRARLFRSEVPEDLVIQREDPDFHYLTRVVRVRKGEQVAFFKGDSRDYVYAVEAVTGEGVALRRTEVQALGTDPVLRLVHVMATLKGDHLADVVRAVVPLGAVQIVPFQAARSVPARGADRTARWQAVADEAVRQCGSTQRAEVIPPAATLEEAISRVRDCPGLLITEGAPLGIGDAVLQLSQNRSLHKARLAILSGPEGGLVAEEIERATQAGFLPCHLGCRILRADLAPVAAAAIAQNLVGDLGPSSGRGSPFPRANLTVDIIVISEGTVLLIRRAKPPFEGCWAIPGGFVDPGEEPIEAARRELKEETGIAGLRLAEIGVFGRPGRDPRGWTVSIAYAACVNRGEVRARAGDDAADVGWFSLSQLPETAFDHAEILARAETWLQRTHEEGSLDEAP